MENNMRFRNHFSIVLPSLKGCLWALLVSIIGLFSGDDTEGRAMMVVVWTVILLTVIYQVLVWSKTWITIQEQSIDIECNTFFNRKKNTIGIKNISNVNLEQNLMARIFGTCKLKLDTNSLSTANSTDVTIVLKKEGAEKVQALLLKLISGEEMPVINEECANILDILMHGVFASRFFYTIIVALFVVLEIVSEIDGEDIAYFIDEVGAFAAQTVGLVLFLVFILIAWEMIAILFSLARNVIRYCGFRIERKAEKLELDYGLVKKVHYSIPVDKIQAVVVKQSFLARLFKRYMVEVVNVGMNDDENEVQAFLLPYDNREILQARMKKLLPEFADYLELKVERQPKGIWAIDIWSILLYVLLSVFVLVGVIELIPDFIGLVGMCLILIGLILLGTRIASYLTKGSKFSQDILVVANGSFARQYTYIKYDKIQDVCLKQNFIAKRLGIQKSIIHLLASSKNQTQMVPYFKEENAEILKQRLIFIGGKRHDI